MYKNLHGDKDAERNYGKHMIYLNVKKFQTYAIHISDSMKDNNWKSGHAWIVPAKFNQLRHIKDLQYLEGDGTLQMMPEAN